MTVTVYKARRDGGAVIVDWRIVESLEALQDAMTDGWATTETVARGLLPEPEPEPVKRPVVAPIAPVARKKK